MRFVSFFFIFSLVHAKEKQLDEVTLPYPVQKSPSTYPTAAPTPYPTNKQTRRPHRPFRAPTTYPTVSPTPYPTRKRKTRCVLIVLHVTLIYFMLKSCQILSAFLVHSHLAFLSFLYISFYIIIILFEKQDTYFTTKPAANYLCDIIPYFCTNSSTLSSFQSAHDISDSITNAVSNQ